MNISTKVMKKQLHTMRQVRLLLAVLTAVLIAGVVAQLLIDCAAGKEAAATVLMTLTFGFLAASIAALVCFSVLISQKRKDISRSRRLEAQQANAAVMETPVTDFEDDTGAPGVLQWGKIWCVGKRPYQEDSYGVQPLEDGLLAVVADGMGGLSGGDRVSKTIVNTMKDCAARMPANANMNNALQKMVDRTNQTVNRMLGPEGLYKSGSTLLSVLVWQDKWHWISVGDSHIYFFRNGELKRVNREHNRGTELLDRVRAGEITMEEAQKDPKKNALTSFIGMGDLKYVDSSRRGIPLMEGDRILLMSDGVFNALSDQTICNVLRQFSDEQAAAAELERLVIRHGDPRQDNFTALIIGV